MIRERPVKSAIRGVGLRSCACEVAMLLLGVRCSPALRLIRFDGHRVGRHESLRGGLSSARVAAASSLGGVR